MRYYCDRSFVRVWKDLCSLDWSHWTFNANLGERCCGNEEGKKNAGKCRGWKPGLWSSRGKFGETKTIIFRTTAYFELRTSGSCVIGGLKDSVVTSKSSTTEVKPLCYWDNWCWSVGAEKLAVIKKKLASLRWNRLESVSSESAQRSCVPEMTKVLPWAGSWSW